MLPYTIVTGVSQGLGEAIADALLGRGARVLGVGRRSSPRLVNARYRFVPCDLADPAELAARVGPALRDIAKTRPAYACLINNAATIDPAGVLGMLDTDAIARSLRVNLAAPVALADLFCSAFRDDAARLRVINVSSGAAEHPIAGEALYCVAKAGLEMLTLVLHAEHGSPTFEAITLRPGLVDTPMQAHARAQPPERFPSVGLFRQFHENHQLVPPAIVAAKVVERLVEGDVESGRTYAYAQL
jgi:benzil reductase ((S)-benzoin forming)